MDDAEIKKLDRRYAREIEKSILENGDIEIEHNNADALLCKLLTELGFTKTVKAWESVPKWYA